MRPRNGCSGFLRSSAARMSHRSGGVASSGPCDEPNPKTILAIDCSLRRAFGGAAATPVTIPQLAHSLVGVADQQCVVADFGALADDGFGKRDQLRQLQRLMDRHGKGGGVLQNLSL